jgi:hypothetical protein
MTSDQVLAPPPLDFITRNVYRWPEPSSSGSRATLNQIWRASSEPIGTSIHPQCHCRAQERYGNSPHENGPHQSIIPTQRAGRWVVGCHRPAPGAKTKGADSQVRGAAARIATRWPFVLDLGAFDHFCLFDWVLNATDGTVRPFLEF